MRPGWIIGILMGFLIASIISGICELAVIGDTETAIFQTLLQPDMAEISNPLDFVTVYATFGWDFITALWKAFWWDYSFLQGSFIYLRYLLICISCGIIFSIIFAMRGTSSG
jgi:hypothetical protein